MRAEPSTRSKREGKGRKLDARFSDEFEIRRLIENWVIWRDSGLDFERFATLWHPEGQMAAIWCRTTSSDFIERSKAAFDRGGRALHLLGGSSVEVAGARATAQTKVAIMVRGLVHDAEVDVTCYGRFFDFLTKLDGRWLLYLRQPIYDLDQMVPTEPGRRIELDADLLGSFPEGYRHMAYMFTQAGLEVMRGLPGTRGPEIEALVARGRAWLDGEPMRRFALATPVRA
jgi:hypothetical protein